MLFKLPKPSISLLNKICLELFCVQFSDISKNMEIEKLKSDLPNDIYKKIIKGNFDSFKSIILTNKEDIKRITKLKPEEIDLLLEIVSKTYIGSKIKNAFEIPAWKKLSSGCKGIDNLLHGGISINGINEIYGESGVGKTQFCLQLALMVQLPETFGGLRKSAVYICTEDPFPSTRLEQLCSKFLSRFEDTDQISIQFQDNIFVEHIADYEQLRVCLYVKLPNLINKVNIGLIVIDSIAGVFRSYKDDKNYTSRSEDFITISKKLYEYSNLHNIGVVCTNQVSDNLDTGETNPSLGLAWSNLVTTRFSITRSFNKSLRKFSVVFAPNLPCNSCDFLIQENGIST